MQMHLRKYICSTGRKEASRSECYETLDVGCPASCVSHLLYLNTVGVAWQFFRQRFRRVECEISSRPAVPRQRSSSSHPQTPCGDSIRSDRDGDNSIASFLENISRSSGAGSIDVSIPQQRCCRALARQVR